MMEGENDVLFFFFHKYVFGSSYARVKSGGENEKQKISRGDTKAREKISEWIYKYNFRSEESVFSRI